jgi:hypothetical protein
MSDEGFSGFIQDTGLAQAHLLYTGNRFTMQGMIGLQSFVRGLLAGAK